MTLLAPSCRIQQGLLAEPNYPAPLFFLSWPGGCSQQHWPESAENPSSSIKGASQFGSSRIKPLADSANATGCLLSLRTGARWFSSHRINSSVPFISSFKKYIPVSRSYFLGGRCMLHLSKCNIFVLSFISSLLLLSVHYANILLVKLYIQKSLITKKAN